MIVTAENIENKPEKYHKFLSDPEKVDEFIDLVRIGFTVVEAAKECGVSRQAVENAITKGRKQTKPSFKGKISEPLADFYTKYMEVNPNARRHMKLDRYVIASFAEIMREGGSIKFAAAHNKLPMTTVQNWIRRGAMEDSNDNPLYAEFTATVEGALAMQEQKNIDRMDDLAFNARSEKVAYEATSWNLERRFGYKEVRRNENVNTNTEITIVTESQSTGYTPIELDWKPELEEGKDASPE